MSVDKNTEMHTVYDVYDKDKCCAMLPTFSHRLYTALRSGSVSQISRIGICGGQSGTGQGFLRVILISLANYYPPIIRTYLSVIRGMDSGTIRCSFPQRYYLLPPGE